MKSKDELNAPKEKVETLNSKFQKLNDEDLEQVTGGVEPLSDLKAGFHDY